MSNPFFSSMNAYLNASDIADWLAFERCLSLTYNNKGEGG